MGGSPGWGSCVLGLNRIGFQPAKEFAFIAKKKKNLKDNSPETGSPQHTLEPNFPIRKRTSIVGCARTKIDPYDLRRLERVGRIEEEKR